jgi:hypothetical protein
MKQLSFTDFCELNDLVIYDSVIDFIECETDIEIITEWELDKIDVERKAHVNIFEDLWITIPDYDKARELWERHDFDIEAQYSDYLENCEKGLLD